MRPEASSIYLKFKFWAPTPWAPSQSLDYSFDLLKPPIKVINIHYTDFTLQSQYGLLLDDTEELKNNGGPPGWLEKLHFWVFSGVLTEAKKPK